MLQKIYVNVTVRLIISADDNIDINEMLDELDYEFTSNTAKADVLEMDIQEYNIIGD